MSEPVIADRAIDARVNGLHVNDAGALLPRGPKSPPPTTTTRSVDLRRLQEELVLLDRARAALDGGQTKDALTALDEHARRFPGGDGIAARESLRIDMITR